MQTGNRSTIVSRTLRAFAPAAFLALVATSCGDKQDPFRSDLGGTIGEEERPITYESHVREILERHCTRCHAADRQGLARQGAPADVDLDSYENAVEHAERANVRIQSDTMPPGGGELDDRERALFQAWIDDGMPRGEPGAGETPGPQATPAPPLEPLAPLIPPELLPLFPPGLFPAPERPMPTPGATPTPSGASVTYESDIQLFLDRVCVRCHDSRKSLFERNGAPLGVDFDTYEGAVRNAVRANARIQEDTMPPGGGVVTDEERQEFQQWVDDGTPRR
jgi:uncharacterized membrane protein